MLSHFPGISFIIKHLAQESQSIMTSDIFKPMTKDYRMSKFSGIFSHNLCYRKVDRSTLVLVKNKWTRAVQMT